MVGRLDVLIGRVRDESESSTDNTNRTEAKAIGRGRSPDPLMAGGPFPMPPSGGMEHYGERVVQHGVYPGWVHGQGVPWPGTRPGYPPPRTDVLG